MSTVDADEEETATVSVIEAEPVIETEQVTEAEPVIETEQVTEAEPVIETEQVTEAEPVIETEQVIETAPATKTDPVIETEKITETSRETEIKIESVTETSVQPSDDDEAVTKNTYKLSTNSLTEETITDGLAKVADSPASDFEFDTQTGTIIKYKGSGGVVNIPGTIKGVKVTVIGYGAFANCDKLTSVSIPSSVTSIVTNAFSKCQNLKSVNIPNSVKSIGYAAFSGCRNLISISIPDSVTNIDNQIFYDCISLTKIDVSSNNGYYSSIDGIFFNKNKTLLIQYPVGKTAKTYTIPNSVTSIEISAFASCNSLTSVSIPNSMMSIGNWVFSGCSSLTEINVASDNQNYLTIDGVLFNKDRTELIKYPEGKTAKTYTIPNSVTSVELESFADCTNLTSVTIPKTVRRIGESAFWGCDNLKWALFKGNAITNFGDCVFDEVNPNFVIYYYKGATGFSNPWYGYPTVAVIKFIDVPANYWAAVNIGRLADKGIINGYSDSTYRPNNNITREEAAAIIVKAVGLSTKGKIAKFPDVPKNSWSSSSIAAAQEAGIINGYSDGTFRPKAKVSREEVAAMVAKAFDLKLKSGATIFKDVPANAWSRRSIDVLTNNNIVNGYSDGTFRPKNPITRAEFAVFISKALK